MGIQDKTEQVLRELHILLSQSEVYDKAAGRVIVDKKTMIGLLQQLDVCIYGMMDEYEVTQQGKDKAARDSRKAGEKIIRDAKCTAEDVYAASVMYTDEALHRAMDIMDETMEAVKDAYRKMEIELQDKKNAIAHNKLELKSQLQDLKDTEKYLRLIEERNKQIEKEKKEEQEKEVSPTAHIKPEIRINREYFEQNGIPIEPDLPHEEAEQKKTPYEENLDAEMLALEEILKEGMKDSGQAADSGEEYYDYGDEPEIKVTPEIRVNLDAEYFKWKENMEIEDFGSEGKAAVEKPVTPPRFGRKK